MTANQGINDVNPVAAVIDDTTRWCTACSTTCDVRSEARFDELTTKFTQVTLEGKHTFSDAFALQRARRLRRIEPRQSGADDAAVGRGQHRRLFIRLSRRQPPSADHVRQPARDRQRRDRQSGDDAQWALSQIRLRPQSTINSFQTASFDLEWKPTETFGLKFGPQWKNFVFKSTELRRSNGTTANQETNVVAAMGVPIVDYSRTQEFGAGLDLPAGSVDDLARAGLQHGARRAAISTTALSIRSASSPRSATTTKSRKTTRARTCRATSASSSASQALRGNVGVRYVETSLTSTGYTFQTGAGPVQQTVDTTYDDVLPSLNLVYDISDSLLVRASAAKVMTRPNLGNLSPGAAVSVSGNSRTVTAGNPELEPFRANAYDASVEWYFAPESLLSLALFYKDITSFVTNVRDNIVFSDNTLGLPDSVAIAACGTTPGCGPGVEWAFTLPTNTEGGQLKGFEISYQQPFSFLPGVLEQFRHHPQLHGRRVRGGLHQLAGPDHQG